MSGTKKTSPDKSPEPKTLMEVLAPQPDVVESQVNGETIHTFLDGSKKLVVDGVYIEDFPDRPLKGVADVIVSKDEDQAG